MFKLCDFIDKHESDLVGFAKFDFFGFDYLLW